MFILYVYLLASVSIFVKQKSLPCEETTNLNEMCMGHPLHFSCLCDVALDAFQTCKAAINI